jgi:hypothetical protein
MNKTLFRNTDCGPDFVHRSYFGDFYFRTSSSSPMGVGKRKEGGCHVEGQGVVLECLKFAMFRKVKILFILPHQVWIEIEQKRIKKQTLDFGILLYLQKSFKDTRIFSYIPYLLLLNVNI